MPEKTPFRCPVFSCGEKFTSHSGRLNHIKLHHPQHLRVAQQTSLTVRSGHRRIQPAQLGQFNADKDSVELLNSFRHLEHLEHIAALESEPPPPPLPQTETYPGADAMLSDYIAEPWERDAEDFLQMNVQNNPYDPCTTCEEYKYIQCGINTKGMKTYCDNLLKEEITPPHFTSFKNGYGVQKVVASIPDDLAHGEWELHTHEDMKCNDNHQRPIKY